MADIKISQLGAAIAVNDSDLLPIVSNGNTLKAPASLVKDYAVGNTDLSGIGDGTPTGAIAALNTELDTTKQALTNVESDIAPIEDGTNYSTSYTKGAQFIRGGLLYKVTASSVNSSTAINTASGGNATLADSVTEQFRNFVKSDTYTGTTNANGIIDTSLSVGERSIIFAIASGRIVEAVNGTGYWTFKILNATDMQPIQNASVSIAYKYI